jgi:hypothetical protein
MSNWLLRLYRLNDVLLPRDSSLASSPPNVWGLTGGAAKRCRPVEASVGRSFSVQFGLPTSSRGACHLIDLKILNAGITGRLVLDGREHFLRRQFLANYCRKLCRERLPSLI